MYTAKVEKKYGALVLNYNPSADTNKYQLTINNKKVADKPIVTPDPNNSGYFKLVVEKMVTNLKEVNISVMGNIFSLLLISLSTQYCFM